MDFISTILSGRTSTPATEATVPRRALDRVIDSDNTDELSYHPFDTKESKRDSSQRRQAAKGDEIKLRNGPSLSKQERKSMKLQREIASSPRVDKGRGLHITFDIPPLAIHNTRP